MNREELEAYNSSRQFSQLCLCTSRPIEEVIDEWVEKLGIGPWGITEMSNETVHDYGWGDKEITEPFKYYCAICRTGSLEFEIVQKCYGPFMGDAFLEDKKSGTGLQHFKETFHSDEEYYAAIKRYEDAGFEKTFYGAIGDNKFCNFASDKFVGFTFEVGNDSDAGLGPDQIRFYP